MATNKQLINVDAWNHISGFSSQNSLMHGEFKTLSEQEVNDLNSALETATKALEVAQKICQEAKARWKASGS